MRLIFLGHACHLVEFDGFRVITDPWLRDPIFGGHVERDPTLGFSLADLPPIDAIALTHGHLDHFNAPTLADWPDKSIPVVHPPIRFTELDANLRRLGFEDLHACDDWEPFERAGVRVAATPSRGVLDECAYLIEGPTGRFWNGADAPQPPEVVTEIAARFGPIDVGGFSHNSFDQPALLGMASMKAAEHGPAGAARSARILGVPFAIAAASNMRWTGREGPAVTRKVIRRGPADFEKALAAEAPDTQRLALEPGDAWTREGGVERGVVAGSAAPRVENDYLHAFLNTGERFCPAGRPDVKETFERDLPALLRARPEASRYLGQPVGFRIRGRGDWTVDFRRPDDPAIEPGGEPPCAIAIDPEDWLDLFERRISWQVLLVSDRLEVLRFRAGLPPDGLHFAYALQALFP